VILLRARYKYNKVVLCLTDTSLYIYIRVKHFGMANIKKRWKSNSEFVCSFHFACSWCQALATVSAPTDSAENKIILLSEVSSSCNILGDWEQFLPPELSVWACECGRHFKIRTSLLQLKGFLPFECADFPYSPV